MPVGNRRKSTTAATSSAISPTTDVLTSVKTWLTLPKSAALEIVPETTDAPPEMTVMKALAM